jgi:transcriptional regulator with XRE-family HTH domain
MPRYLPSNSLSAAVRAHFGLTQTELGDYLGVQREQVAFVEAGQRGFSVMAERRLRPLGLLLPELRAGGPPAPLAAEPVVSADAPEVAALRKRLRRCRHQAAQLRYELENQAARTQSHTNRQRGLAQLQAGLLPSPASAAAPTADDERARRWLAQLAADTPPAPPYSTTRALLAARLQGLVAEAEALEALLAATAAIATGNQE